MSFADCEKLGRRHAAKRLEARAGRRPAFSGSRPAANRPLAISEPAPANQATQRFRRYRTRMSPPAVQSDRVLKRNWAARKHGSFAAPGACATWSLAMFRAFCSFFSRHSGTPADGGSVPTTPRRSIWYWFQARHSKGTAPPCRKVPHALPPTSCRSGWHSQILACWRRNKPVWLRP